MFYKKRQKAFKIRTNQKNQKTTKKQTIQQSSINHTDINQQIGLSPLPYPSPPPRLDQPLTGRALLTADGTSIYYYKTQWKTHKKQKETTRKLEKHKFCLSKTALGQSCDLDVYVFLTFFVFLQVLKNKRNHWYCRPNHDRGVAQDRTNTKENMFSIKSCFVEIIKIL